MNRNNYHAETTFEFNNDQGTLDEQEVIKIDVNNDMKQNDTTSAAWPEDFCYISAITIREDRFNYLQKRLSWLPYPITKVIGTNGTRIDKEWWIKEKYLNNHKLRKGEIGCYDSHRRIWEYIVNHKLPMAVIFEDDADLQIKHLEMINKAYQELQMIDEQWEIFFLSRNQRVIKVQTRLSDYIAIPDRQSIGAFAYVVTLRGAKKLLSNCLPIQMPLDHFLFFQMHDKMRMYCVEPNLFHVVPVFSDTTFIF